MGCHPTGPLTDLSLQAWSAVWKLPTTRGSVVIKKTTPARATEIAVQRFCSAIAPEYVDRPIAWDTDRCLIMVPDRGPTLLDLNRESAAEATCMIKDYVGLQQATIGQRAEAMTIGMPTWDPTRAPEELTRQAHALHALPESDLRHISTEQRDILIGRRDAVRAAGQVLAGSRVPFCLNHGDLWPGNVLPPTGDNAHHRFIDFGDAAWTHPFLSLPACLHYYHQRWCRAGVAFDLNHPALQPLIDSYLDAWAECARPAELRAAITAAARLAPLRRSTAAIENFDHAGPTDRDELGPTPWQWLNLGWPDR